MRSRPQLESGQRQRNNAPPDVVPDAPQPISLHQANHEQVDAGPYRSPHRLIDQDLGKDAPPLRQVDDAVEKVLADQVPIVRQRSVGQQTGQEAAGDPSPIERGRDVPALRALRDDVPDGVHGAAGGGLGEDGVGVQDVVVEGPVVEGDPGGGLLQGPAAGDAAGQVDGEEGRQGGDRDGGEEAEVDQLVAGGVVGRVVQDGLEGIDYRDCCRVVDFEVEVEVEVEGHRQGGGLVGSIAAAAVAVGGEGRTEGISSGSGRWSRSAGGCAGWAAGSGGNGNRSGCKGTGDGTAAATTGEEQGGGGDRALHLRILSLGFVESFLAGRDMCWKK